MCFKLLVRVLNSTILRIKPRTVRFNSFFFYIPNSQHSVSRQAHPLLRRGLGRQRFRLGEAPPLGLGDRISRLSEHSYPTVSSHIPSFGGAWGGSFFPVLGLLHPLFFRHFVLCLRLCGLHLVTTRVEFYGICDVQTALIINRNINGNILITVRIG